MAGSCQDDPLLVSMMRSSDILNFSPLHPMWG
jgi:hypothetical protein